MRFKEIIKKLLPRKIFYLVRDIFYPEKINVLESSLKSQFLARYQSMIAPNLDQKAAFRNAEFKVYSKHGGDGILAYIFSKIGVTNCRFVEVGVEEGRECNTANLSLNFGWRGLLVDANEEWVKSAKVFYKEKLGNSTGNVKTVACFVTAENINQLFSDNGFQGEIDLLSIDIDSNDYWVWKSITTVNPRVVVMEYNATFGLRPLTVKYDPQFHFQKAASQNPLYFGASLVALNKLAKEKGYILVACDTHGHDAFFVRQDIALGKFISLSPEEAFYPNPYAVARFGDVDAQFKRVKHLNFEEV